MKLHFGAAVLMAAMSVASVGHADSVQQSYDGAVRAKIASVAYYPEAAVHSGRQGVVALAVTVGDGGAITNAVVEKSSGVKALDQAAVAAVRAAAPFSTGSAEATVFHTSIRYELAD